VQPTYLAVYVESADQFLTIDLKEWVTQNYGEDIMNLPQKTVRVRVPKRNPIDLEFFRLVLNKNLLPSLRRAFAQDDDEKIVRFLRDSSVVKWLANCNANGARARLTVVNYMSKTRTEVYFERKIVNGGCERFMAHWQFMMRGIAEAFPYLSFNPERKAVISGLRIFFVDHDDTDAIDDESEEDLDRECLLAVTENEYSYGQMLSGEFTVHHIQIALNEIGESWAATLNVLENAEVITVS
jgi:hypothetical protein